jgi:hypothetical protein
MIEGDHTKDCDHSWDERGWVATFTTAELEQAEKENYAISNVKEVCVKWLAAGGVYR